MQRGGLGLRVEPLEAGSVLDLVQELVLHIVAHLCLEQIGQLGGAAVIGSAVLDGAQEELLVPLGLQVDRW